MQTLCACNARNAHLSSNQAQFLYAFISSMHEQLCKVSIPEPLRYLHNKLDKKSRKMLYFVILLICGHLGVALRHQHINLSLLNYLNQQFRPIASITELYSLTDFISSEFKRS